MSTTSATRRSKRADLVADAMLRRPKVIAADSPTAEARRLLGDDHVHLVLVTDADGVLLTTVEREDLAGPDASRVCELGTLDGRVVAAGTPVVEAVTRMRAGNRRRLAVVDAEGRLLGLLCLKRSGNGFCSDGDVAARREGRPRVDSVAR